MRLRSTLSIAAAAGLLAAPLSAQAAEPPVAPTVTITNAPGDPGILVATATSDTEVTAVAATVQRPGADPVTVTLQRDGTSTTWRSGRLVLGAADVPATYGDYQVSADATDTAGDKTTAAAVLHYLQQPVVVEHTVAPTALDAAHPLTYAQGALKMFDPVTGVEHPAADSTVTATWGTALQPAFSAEVQPDGRYAIKERPADLTVTSRLTISLVPAPGVAPLQDTQHGKPFLDQVDVTATVAAARVAMKTTKTTVTYPNKVSLTGRLLVGTVPVPDATVTVSLNGKAVGTVQTSSTGYFAYPTAPRTGGTYGFSWTPTELQQPYVTGVTNGSEVVNVTTPTALSFTKPSINEESMMHIAGTLTAKSGIRAPKGTKVWLQRSVDGKTGWANVGYLPTDVNGSVKLEGWLPHASGYFRLNFYGATGLKPSSSWVYRSTRKETRLITLNAAPEPVRKGRTVTVTGVVQKLVGKSWVSMGRYQQVQVFFRPKGASASTPFTYQGSASTTATGAFTFKGKAVRDGDWTAAWFTPNQWNVNAYGYVDAVDVK